MSDKEELRKKIRQERHRLSADKWQALSDGAYRQFTFFFSSHSFHCIHIFNSFKNEPDTEVILRHLFAKNKRVVCPKILKKRKLAHFEIKSLSELKPSKWGILEPCETTPVQISEIDLIVLPGLAFSPKGDRLGQGGGFYDTFLATTAAVKVGLCFEFQLVDPIPLEKHDQKVDVIITEKRVIKINPSI